MSPYPLYNVLHYTFFFGWSPSSQGYYHNIIHYITLSIYYYSTFPYYIETQKGEGEAPYSLALSHTLYWEQGIRILNYYHY